MLAVLSVFIRLCSYSIGVYSEGTPTFVRKIKRIDVFLLKLSSDKHIYIYKQISLNSLRVITYLPSQYIL